MEIVWSIIQMLTGLAIGTIVSVALIMLILPVYAAGGLFVNKPTEDGPSGIHFFTKIAPGEVKIIVRGDKIVRMVTDTANKTFARAGGDKNAPAYWELVSTPGKSEDPTADIHWMFRLWAKLVYKFTGAVFTGIYPIQRVYEYPVERTVIERKEDGATTRSKGSNLTLRVKSDFSDHFRTRQFLYPIHVTEAETKDKIPLDIIGVAELEVTNPHKAANGTDRWDHAVINMATDKITDATKVLTLDQALTADDPESARAIAKSVEDIMDDELNCGISFTRLRILEINPALDKDGLRDIQSQALSTQRAKGMRIEGEARADNLKAINQANAEGGEHSLATMQMEGTVRAAEAAGKGGGSVILMAGQSAPADATQLAILAELKKLNTK
jgi:hypothetical protein